MINLLIEWIGIYTMAKPLVEHARENEELEQLRAANRRLQRELAVKTGKIEDLVAAVYEAAKDAALTMGPAPAIRPPIRDKRHGEEVALIHMTDIQYGKKTTSYDREVAEYRLLGLFLHKIRLLTKIQRSDHPVKSAHLMLGGDFLENLNIFPGQAYEVDSTAYEQLFGFVRILKIFIQELLADFELVEIWQEDGNHGRIGRRGDWPKGDNFDLILYNIVHGDLNDKRLVWHEHKPIHQNVIIGNYSALLAHGDEVNSYGGNLPAYGIYKKGLGWKTSARFPWTDMYMGHFHTPTMLTLPDGGRIFVTGSPESDNFYAREFMAADGIPSQRLNFIDPRKGRVAAEYVVWLNE